MLSTNPFLQMIAALGEEDVTVENPPPPNVQRAGAPQVEEEGEISVIPGTSRPVNLKLPEYWPHSPGLWFARAECRFEMAAITSERTKFCCVSDALNYEATRLVADLIAAPPAINPYTALKERLMLAHQLSPVERAEKLLDIPDLGARRPSDLLAAMFEYCTAGEENSVLFRAIFLKRLPAEVRVLLVAEDTTSLESLATRADKLWAKFGQKKDNSLAAVQPRDEPQAADSADEHTVAAMAGKKRFNKKKKRGGGNTNNSNNNNGNQQGTGGSSQRSSKGKQVFLCHTHLKYGSNAFFCAEPNSCAWPEN
jgi:hypothetical protein